MMATTNISSSSSVATAGAAKPLPVLTYETFSGTLTPFLIVPATLLALVSAAGITLNAAVVYVTVRSKTLRGTCQYLLALTSVGEVRALNYSLHKCKKNIHKIAKN
jgi:hypothetical protein